MEAGDQSKKRMFKRFWENLTRRDLKHFSKYVNTTATHGVRRMFVGTSKIRRLFWVVLFVTAMVGALYNCGDRIRFLVSKPVTSLYTFEHPSSGLPFPAVTFCNVNTASRRKLDMNYKNVLDFLSCFLFELSYQARFNLSLCNSTGVHQSILDSFIGEIVFNASQDKDDFIVSCQWQGRECPIGSITKVGTNIGLCYTFNGNFTRGEELRVKSSGARFGLSLVLNIERDDYLRSTLFEGVVISVHDQEVPPRPLQSGIYTAPGSSSFVALAVTDYHFLRPPFGDCSDGKPLNFYSTYSIPACLLDQLFSRTGEYCECIDPSAPDPLDKSKYSGLRRCSLRNISCVIDQFNQVPDESSCPTACFLRKYTSQVSYAAFPASRHFSIINMKHDNINFSDTESARNNLVNVNVYFEDIQIANITEQEGYTVTALFSDIGGQLGLFLGVSILSITELLMWLIDECKDRLFCGKHIRKSKKDWRIKTFIGHKMKSVDLQEDTSQNSKSDICENRYISVNDDKEQ